MPRTSDKPPARAVARTSHLAFALVPGFLDVSLGVTMAIVQTANALCRSAGRPPAFRLSLVGPARRAGLSSAGIRVAHQPLDTACEADVLIVPGTFVEDGPAMEAWVTQPAMTPWLQLLRDKREAGALVAASCAGTWLLAEAGVLDGRRATTVWWLGAAFRDRYPAVRLDTRQMVVSDGPLTTAGAAFAHTDLMLHLVARTTGGTMAEHCARLLLADRREVQSRHVSLSWMAAADPLMTQACSWIDKHLAEAVRVADLAKALHTTPRTLARRCQQALGVPPWRLVQRRRIEAAAALLRTTTLPFAKIANRVGYADPSALRLLIRRDLGVAPSSLRVAAVDAPDRR